MISIQKYTINDALLAEAGFSVRRSVFVDEQNVLPDEEFEGEEESIHFLLFYNQVPVATARWRQLETGIKLERFAVLKEYRNKGLGSLILQAVLIDLKDRPEKLYLHAQLSALRFYERAGFVREGGIFEECEILHYKMTYNPAVLGSINELIYRAYDYLLASGYVPAQQEKTPENDLMLIQISNMEQALEAFRSASLKNEFETIRKVLGEQLYLICQAVSIFGLQETFIREVLNLHEQKMSQKKQLGADLKD